jgi:hypothetical protein
MACARISPSSRWMQSALAPRCATASVGSPSPPTLARSLRLRRRGIYREPVRLQEPSSNNSRPSERESERERSRAQGGRKEAGADSRSGCAAEELLSRSLGLRLAGAAKRAPFVGRMSSQASEGRSQGKSGADGGEALERRPALVSSILIRTHSHRMSRADSHRLPTQCGRGPRGKKEAAAP